MNDLNDRSDPWPHATKATRILGRQRQLIANADYSLMLVVDHGGGFEPTRQDLFEVINDLIEAR